MENNQSSNTSRIVQALSKAQAEIKPPVKNRHVDFTDRNNRQVKYSYADLADVILSYKDPLTKNGLAITHSLGYSDGENLFGLTTLLLHESGEHLKTWYPLPDPQKQNIRAQEFGSALTYARRYSVSSLLGIASEEDDDGNAAATAAPPKGNQNQGSQGRSNTPAKSQNQTPRPQNQNTRPKDAPPAPMPPAPEDDVQKFPEENLDQRPKNEQKKNQPDPGDFIMPLGAEDVKGRPLAALNEPTLIKIFQWTESEMKKTPPPQNISVLFEVNNAVKAFLKSVNAWPINYAKG